MIQLKNVLKKVLKGENKNVLRGYVEPQKVLVSEVNYELGFSKPIYSKIKTVEIPKEEMAKLEMFKRSFRFLYADVIREETKVITVKDTKKETVDKTLSSYFRKNALENKIVYHDFIEVVLEENPDVKMLLELTDIKKGKFGYPVPFYQKTTNRVG